MELLATWEAKEKWLENQYELNPVLLCIGVFRVILVGLESTEQMVIMERKDRKVSMVDLAHQDQKLVAQPTTQNSPPCNC